MGNFGAYYGKRSADAEPGYGYGRGGYGYGGRGYGRGYYGKREAEAEPSCGYGRGYYGKRSADAEPKADAGVIVAGPAATIATTSDAAHTYAAPALTTSYGYGLGYSAGYPYGSLAYAAPYSNFGAYYGKRSADAEPGYGYGRGGYGYGGRGYGRGYYGKREA